VAVVNLASGSMLRSGFRNRWLAEIRRAAATVVFCDGRGHATKLASELESFDGVVVAGGDGTILETLASLDRSQHCMAVLPCGRGNSLARELGVADMSDALAVLSGGETRRLDLLELEATLAGGGTTQAYCAGTVAIGYVASVGARAGRFVRAGRHSYTLATLITCPSKFELRLSYDEAPPIAGTLTGLVISNLSHVAHYRAFPDARFDDGLLDVMELEAGWLRQLCHNASVLLGNDLVKARYVTQCKCIRAQISRATDILVDGEIIEGVSALSVRCMPSAALFRMAKAP
jgi:diacylglycerol kinase family enzyme